MMEFYQAYSDYKDLMDLTEEMLKHSSDGRSWFYFTTFTVTKQLSSVALTLTWHVRCNQTLHLKMQTSALTEDDLQNRELIVKIAEEVGLYVEVLDMWSASWRDLWWNELSLGIQPTFITGYPADISPLARRSDSLAPFLHRPLWSFFAHRWPWSSERFLWA